MRGVPREIIAKLNAEMHAVLKMPDVDQRLSSMSDTIVVSTPDKLREHKAAETQKRAKVIESAGVRPE